MLLELKALKQYRYREKLCTGSRTDMFALDIAFCSNTGVGKSRCEISVNRYLYASDYVLYTLFQLCVITRDVMHESHVSHRQVSEQFYEGEIAKHSDHQSRNSGGGGARSSMPSASEDQHKD